MSGPEITLAPHEYRRINVRSSAPVMPAGQRALCAAFGAILLYACISIGWTHLYSGALVPLVVLAVVTWGSMGLLLLSTALWPNGRQTRV
jgi:ABC-type uncharacterized transport system permease subunit